MGPTNANINQPFNLYLKLEASGYRVTLRHITVQFNWCILVIPWKGSTKPNVGGIKLWDEITESDCFSTSLCEMSFLFSLELKESPTGSYTRVGESSAEEPTGSVTFTVCSVIAKL
jgi:hypothetical protein